MDINLSNFSLVSFLPLSVNISSHPIGLIFFPIFICFFLLYFVFNYLIHLETSWICMR